MAWCAGKLAETNAAQVTQVRKIIEGLGLEVATPAEAREILELKGGDRVGILTADPDQRSGPAQEKVQYALHPRPLADQRFVLDHVVGIAALAAT